MTGIQSVSISPEGLREATFSSESAGYDRGEVRSLLASAADALELAWREKNDLTASMTADDTEISSRAVLLLSNAQRIADDAVAEAEAYSRDLIETARNQYREIIERAQQAAHDLERQGGAPAAGSAPASSAAVSAPAAAAATSPGWSPDQSPAAAFATDDLDAAGTASPSEVVRARQFTRMAAAQAHSLLESIERELARLGKNPGGPTDS
jgi:cell division septum initiation protein DivIVA